MNYSARVAWQRSPGEEFEKGMYSRVHQWIFDGGMEISASSSPSVVPVPLSDPSLVDPEEAFLACLSSCHMLFFLSFAAKKKWVVERYEDHIQGMMGENSEGRIAMLTATLHPTIIFAGTDQPPKEIVSQLHELAHTSCFIANSVKTKVEIIAN